MKHFVFLLGIVSFVTVELCAQRFSEHAYFQQHVDYQIEVELDVRTNQYNATQKVVYTNHSLDTLHALYFHEYFNAFQPGSSMDVRSRNIMDPSKKIGDRIVHLSEEEQGYMHISNVNTGDGKACAVREFGTLAEVDIPALLPGDSISLEMQVAAQVPLQVRRSGRDNAQGIRYTMTQWYPKVAGYDHHGWHLDQYIGREFFAEFGNFEVFITLNKDYMVGGTGILQNPKFLSQDFGYSHQNLVVKETKYTSSKKRNTWHFKAENVIDFAWAADPDFKHSEVKTSDGKMLHFIYQDDEEGWKNLMNNMPLVFSKAQELFGPFGYPQYSFIQGGDGGMEYPMCTMIKSSSRGTAIHELMHSWYQGMLATNEGWFPWMDEGFTTWSSGELEYYLGWQTGEEVDHSSNVRNLRYLMGAELQEPLTTHADCYHTNTAHGINAYSKGALFVETLKYLVGEEILYTALRTYHKKWAYRHPEPQHFVKILEDISGVDLDYFFLEWTGTNHSINYRISGIEKETKSDTRITLSRKGKMAMPVKVLVQDKDGNIWKGFIPLLEMQGVEKIIGEKWVQSEAFSWVYPEVSISFPLPAEEIALVSLYGTENFPDMEPEGNTVATDGLDWEKHTAFELVYTKQLLKSVDEVTQQEKILNKIIQTKWQGL